MYAIVPVCALVATLVMETIGSPGLHLPEHAHSEAAPEQTDHRWNTRIGIRVFPKDRQGFLDHVEQRADARSGRTLARTATSVTVLTDRADAVSTLEMAQASQRSKLGQHYVPWARTPHHQPLADGPADQVLKANTFLPFTAHPATEPMLISVGIAAGLAFTAFLDLCFSGIRFRL